MSDDSGFEGAIVHGGLALYDLGEAVVDGVTDPAPGESSESPLMPLQDAEEQTAEATVDTEEGLAGDE
jgi:hypothetical protein